MLDLYDLWTDDEKTKYDRGTQNLCKAYEAMGRLAKKPDFSELARQKWRELDQRIKAREERLRAED